jgi:ATP-dependent Lhr-like helicase
MIGFGGSPMGATGWWRLTHPDLARHRLNAGIIVDAEMIEVASATGARWAGWRRISPPHWGRGIHSVSPGWIWRLKRCGKAPAGARVAAVGGNPVLYGARIPISSHLADRARIAADRSRWADFPTMCVNGWRCRPAFPPAPTGRIAGGKFSASGRFYSAFYTFEGWPANQSLGMLITKRMEASGLMPLGFVANDYALAVWGLRRLRIRRALSPEILTDEFVAWVAGFLSPAPRLSRGGGDLWPDRAPIAGQAQERAAGHFSTDLIYDVLRRYEPDHMLLDAAWADARRMTDVARVGKGWTAHRRAPP